MPYGGKTTDYLRIHDAHIEGKDVVDKDGRKIGYVNPDDTIRDRESGRWYEPPKK